MLRKMLLLSPEYFEGLHRDKDELDIEARKEMRSLLKEEDNAHPYNSWVKLREVRDIPLRRAMTWRSSIRLPI